MGLLLELLGALLLAGVILAAARQSRAARSDQGPIDLGIEPSSKSNVR